MSIKMKKEALLEALEAARPACIAEDKEATHAYKKEVHEAAEGMRKYLREVIKMDDAKLGKRSIYIIVSEYKGPSAGEPVEIDFRS